MTAEFKEGDRVQHASKLYFGHIKYLDDYEALVKNEKSGQLNLVSRAWLLHADVPKKDPLKPGWYALNGRYGNFIYYAAELDGKICYSAAYNPLTGEMSTEYGFPVLFAKVLIGAKPGDLTRMNMVPA